MDTAIIINGVVIQREWVEAIERDMINRSTFTRSTLSFAASQGGCRYSLKFQNKLASKCLNTWRKLGKIMKANHTTYRLATPAETEANNLKMKGGVA